MSHRILRLRARPLIEVLRALGRSGARLPAIRIAGYTVGLDSSNRRLYARSRRRFLGSISISGIFRVGKRVSEKDLASVRALVENTLHVARGAAILLGMNARCAACGRLLDSKDRLRGVGVRCYESGEFWRLEKETNGKKSDRVGVRLERAE